MMFRSLVRPSMLILNPEVEVERKSPRTRTYKGSKRIGVAGGVTNERFLRAVEGVWGIAVCVACLRISR